jgi:uncharacterized Zn-binding protein involved in type VI secretion
MTVPQAHVRNPIAHADLSGFAVGTVVGLVVGAAIVVVTIGTGGTVTVLGAIAIASTATSAGTTMGEMVVNPETARNIEGYIVDGSPDTFIGLARQKAARAKPDDPKTLVDCHPSNYVIQGSETAFINRCSASRRGDGTSCGGIIMEGDPSVLTGEGQATLFDWGGVPRDANLVLRDGVNLGVGVAGLAGLPTTKLGGYLYAGSLAAVGLQGAEYAQDVSPSTTSQRLGAGLAVGGAYDFVTDPGNAELIDGAARILRMR